MCVSYKIHESQTWLIPQTLMLTASVDPLGKFGSLELLARATLIVMAPPSVHRQNFQLPASAGGRALLPLLALTAW